MMSYFLLFEFINNVFEFDIFVVKVFVKCVLDNLFIFVKVVEN